MAKKNVQEILNQANIRAAKAFNRPVQAEIDRLIAEKATYLSTIAEYDENIAALQKELVPVATETTQETTPEATPENGETTTDNPGE